MINRTFMSGFGRHGVVEVEEVCCGGNRYCHPNPKKKPMKRLTLIGINVHTEERIRHEKRMIDCCEEIVKVKERVTKNVLELETECLTPDTYYTVDIDREIPECAREFDVIAEVFPCGFYRGGEVGIRFTEAIPECCGDDDGFEGNGECCRKERKEKGVFIPVKLDNKGNICTGQYISGNRCKLNGYPHRMHKLVFYLNNAGEFTLCRNWRNYDFA
jgi:hypothetical protein